ncbi:chymotrypsin-elastase inhibitor ixodidin-like [Fopius arisanus]|uniref:Chymotrypsin-elastase inhibitor ixodidin-like n=1 Tax=Fopius arisanus TaxID=64838 RepID=A0A9R1SXR7_9HYME|nr:PREDICTED: chymotrypsin-elastase inhibitor ixodidin-like [Fopius arisanus]
MIRASCYFITNQQSNMARLGLFLILTLALICIGEINAQRCPPNEVWRACRPPCNTCMNRNPNRCPACIRGCFCRRGFLRDRVGKCVQRCWRML